MSDYTPTTRQVRDFWASDGNLQPAAKPYGFAESAAAFDRWLLSIQADAVREVAEERFFDRDDNRALPGYHVLHRYADRVEGGGDE